MPGLGDELARRMFQDMERAWTNPDGSFKAHPNARPAPPIGGLAGAAGINDIGSGTPLAFTNAGGSRGSPPMPLDPRMLAYQNQQNAQMAQQAWNRPPQQPQMAQPQTTWPEAQATLQPQAAPQPSLADMLYGLLSPAFGGGGTRY